MTQQRIAVKEQRRLLPDQKLYTSKFFLTASLNFGEIWENLFGEKKKQFILEMASCWQIFLAKKNKILLSATRA